MVKHPKIQAAAKHMVDNGHVSEGHDHHEELSAIADGSKCTSEISKEAYHYLRDSAETHGHEIEHMAQHH